MAGSIEDEEAENMLAERVLIGKAVDKMRRAVVMLEGERLPSGEVVAHAADLAGDAGGLLLSVSVGRSKPGAKGGDDDG